jgi:hypothetical protein
MNHCNRLILWSSQRLETCCYFIKYKAKSVNQSHYRPGEALGVPGIWGSQISRQLALEGGKVFSHTHRPRLRARKYSWYSFLFRGWVDPRDIVRPKGLCQWKIPVTSSEIEPATFWFVVQCFNQLRHRGSLNIKLLQAILLFVNFNNAH